MRPSVGSTRRVRLNATAGSLAESLLPAFAVERVGAPLVLDNMQNKKSRVRLPLVVTTLRHLSQAELLPVVGGSVQIAPAVSDGRGVCTTRPGH